MAGIPLIAIVFIPLNILMIAYTAKKFRNASASLNWPSVGGIVDLMEDNSYETDDGMIYRYKMAYSYTVNEQLYTGKSIDDNDSSIVDTKKSLLNILYNYSLGTKVTVYYDPEDPATSVLIPGVRTSAYGSLFVCILIMAMSIALTLFLG